MVDFEFGTNLGDFTLVATTKERKTTKKQGDRGWVGMRWGANGRRSTWKHIRTIARQKEEVR